MNNNNQENGNTQLNTIRNDFNDRVQSKSYMGKSYRLKLNNKRRYRTI